MIDFLKRLFGHTGSSSAAKERLRLVLMTDHLELAPEMIDAMKRDLVDVISRYVEVDREKIDVTFEQQDKTLAMLANIPILAVHRNGEPATAVNGTANGNATPAPANGTAVAEPLTAVAALSFAEAVPVAEAAVPVPKRRRRRRKKAKAQAAAEKVERGDVDAGQRYQTLPS